MPLWRERQNKISDVRGEKKFQALWLDLIREEKKKKFTSSALEFDQPAGLILLPAFTSALSLISAGVFNFDVYSSFRSSFLRAFRRWFWRLFFVRHFYVHFSSDFDVYSSVILTFIFTNNFDVHFISNFWRSFYQWFWHAFRLNFWRLFCQQFWRLFHH